MTGPDRFAGLRGRAGQGSIAATGIRRERGQMTGSREPADGGVPFDTSRAHMARVYDFWLGGKDNYAADRAVAEQVAAAYPDVLVAVRAQPAAPASRVVYVDNDPIVLGHARALLSSSPEGATAYINADLRDTPAILERAAGVLDFGQPVAVMLLGILQ